MRPIGTGEAERLLGVPSRTLRHWEAAVPLLSPRRGDSGRRVYAERDLQILFGIRRLVECRRLPLAEACERLVAERAESEGELREALATIAEVRSELVSAWVEARRLLDRLPGRTGREPAHSETCPPAGRVV
ncbi:MAG: MerR family transcriptional regulator [Spirochaetales bacterium]|nr:MerR family transcriptional regulator [Spirochaetales bacterium]